VDVPMYRSLVFLLVNVLDLSDLSVVSTNVTLLSPPCLY
jgi:hypothetical protein